MRINATRLDGIAESKQVPRATYRLQFNAEFTLDKGAAVASYLGDLGISDAYASPIFQAGPQSTHGYDICCYGSIASSLGGREALDRFTAALKQQNMGLVLDFVPNHMGADPSNAWWVDVLEHGQQSPFADFFDIDWAPRHTVMQGQILLPVLEDHYARVVRTGKIRLAWDDAGYAFFYYQNRYPVASRCYGMLLEAVLNLLPERERAGEVITQLRALAAGFAPTRKTRKVHPAEFLKLKQMLKLWADNAPAIKQALQQAAEQFNGDANHPESFDRLHLLLCAQNYRLAHWRVGPAEINYRRFFDITGLVCVRASEEKVFESAHALVLELLRGGVVRGLRIDHPDGLENPRRYFEQLQEAFVMQRLGPECLQAGGKSLGKIRAWLNGTDPGSDAKSPPQLRRPLYILAEKILTGDEPLPENWLVDGTTGYDFLNLLNGIFVDRKNEDEITRSYREWAGGNEPFQDLVYRSKLRVLGLSFSGDLESLAWRLRDLGRAWPHGTDISLEQYREALAALLGCFPVYRTYMEKGGHPLSPRDQEVVETALVSAKARLPKVDTAVWDLIWKVMLEKPEDALARDAAAKFTAKFQQLAGPLMAKGLEDTAFYNYFRLLSLNDVGGDPGQFGVDLKRFHEANLERVAKWPHALLATATHDTKRGEDVRARLNVLSEIPHAWAEAASRWRKLNLHLKPSLNGSEAPDLNDEYFLYQTLVGAWPMEGVNLGRPALLGSEIGQPSGEFIDRITAFLMKAIKEAKRHTTWTDPNEDYERNVEEFARQVLGNGEFLRDFIPFLRQVAWYGQLNSLSQTLLKLTVPGVPDIYQGTELWDLSLVDPDNRREVDYSIREGMLARLRAATNATDTGFEPLIRRLIDESASGEIKLYLMYQALQLRRREETLFTKGSYEPLEVVGFKARCVCAFVRRHHDQLAVVVVPRLVVDLADANPRLPSGKAIWGDTACLLPKEFPQARYRNVLTGEPVQVTYRENQGMLVLSEMTALMPWVLLVPQD